MATSIQVQGESGSQSFCGTHYSECGGEGVAQSVLGMFEDSEIILFLCNSGFSSLASSLLSLVNDYREEMDVYEFFKHIREACYETHGKFTDLLLTETFNAICACVEGWQSFEGIMLLYNDTKWRRWITPEDGVALYRETGTLLSENRSIELKSDIVTSCQIHLMYRFFVQKFIRVYCAVARDFVQFLTWQSQNGGVSYAEFSSLHAIVTHEPKGAHVCSIGIDSALVIDETYTFNDMLSILLFDFTNCLLGKGTTNKCVGCGKYFTSTQDGQGTKHYCSCAV